MEGDHGRLFFSPLPRGLEVEGKEDRRPGENGEKEHVVGGTPVRAGRRKWRVSDAASVQKNPIYEQKIAEAATFVAVKQEPSAVRIETTALLEPSQSISHMPHTEQPQRPSPRQTFLPVSVPHQQSQCAVHRVFVLHSASLWNPYCKNAATQASAPKRQKR